MRGILINPFDTTITEVNYTGDYKEIYALTDCTTFDCVRIYETQDMYIDDEGETISTNLDLQMVEDMVEWLPEGHTEEPYMEFITL